MKGLVAIELYARSHCSQLVEDVAATGILVQGRLSDGDASSWPMLRELRWVSICCFAHEGWQLEVARS